MASTEQSQEIEINNTGKDVLENGSVEHEDNTKESSEFTSIKILEIAHVIQDKIIYLTGCTDKEYYPLLICSPQQSTISLTEEEFVRTITYLKYTAKLLWENRRFVVIIDRQNNKWSNVKNILQLLQNFDEDELFHILLLKPQGFMQRHFGNNAPTSIQDTSKHKILFLDNTVHLSEYVEQSQLPDELGGFDSFNVLEWVEYTTAIERFQQTYNKVKTRLTNVTALFADKLPLASLSEIDEQSKQHTQLVEDIMDDIKCTVEIADTLLPIVNKPLSHSRKAASPLEKYNSAQLTVCTERLSTFGEELDNLWEEQNTYHEQAREVCRFEQSYGEISIRLMQITSILESRVDIGDTLQSANDLMAELDDFELKQKEPYEEMMVLKEKGLKMLVLFGPFAQNSIRYRCDEIKNMCKDFEEKLVSRRDLLQVSLDVFNCLDKLDGWCKKGVELLASQAVEDFSHEEGANKCLKQIDRFMKNNQGINMKKMNQINTLCKKLQNSMLDGKVEDALKRIEEVKVMLEKREASLKKVTKKLVRPVQPVKALVIDKEPFKKYEKPMSVTSPISPVSKNEIAVVISDDIEKNKRNKTFRKSLRMSFKRPVSSPSQLQLAEYEEDPEHRKKIRHVITELINTEDIYINDLRCILEGYFVAFDDKNFNIPEHICSKKDIVFGNIEEIYEFHRTKFSEELKVCKEAPYLAGQIFMNKKEEFQLYATYCKNKPKSEALRKELHETTFLKECQKRLGHQLNLDSYLLKPVQRITKYKLLLTEMLKYVSKKTPAHADIMEALYTMKKVLRHVNDVMHSSGLIGFTGNLDDQGKLILQDAFTVWELKKNSLRQFTKLGAKQRQVFLFEKCLILSKKEIDNGKELGTYQCKLYLQTADIGVTESVKGDKCKFEIRVQRRNETYVLQAPNMEVKNNWLNEIRKILMSQFEGVKESRKSVILDESPNLSREEIKDKLKFIDGSLSSSSPSLVTNTEGVLDESGNSLNHSSSVNNLLTEEDSDSAWSDSEFDSEEDTFSSGRNKNKYVSTDVDTVDPQISANTFTAIADFTSLENAEITFHEGDLFNLIKEGEGGWWYCKHLKQDLVGWVPSGFLELHVVDVTHVSKKVATKVKPVKPTLPSPRRCLETAV